MFTAIVPKNRSSSILAVSRAKEDIVVREPQKPTAISKEYFESRFQATASIEKAPRISCL
jgi:hypothetical protein